MTVGVLDNIGRIGILLDNSRGIGGEVWGGGQSSALWTGQDWWRQWKGEMLRRICLGRWLDLG